MVDVQPARRHVGGDEDLRLLVPEQLHHAVALLLHHPAVQRLGAVAVRAQDLGELVDFDPGPAEHDGRLRPLEVEHAPERGVLVGPRHQVGHLPHARQLAARQLLARDGDT